jgi:hypothetical protein
MLPSSGFPQRRRTRAEPECTSNSHRDFRSAGPHAPIVIAATFRATTRPRRSLLLSPAIMDLTVVASPPRCAPSALLSDTNAMVSSLVFLPIRFAFGRPKNHHRNRQSSGRKGPERDELPRFPTAPPSHTVVSPNIQMITELRPVRSNSSPQQAPAAGKSISHQFTQTFGHRK